MNDFMEILEDGLCFQTPERLTDIDSWHGHIPFAFSLTQLVQPAVFVELGTHKGDSYCAFCQAVRALNLDTACYAVDTWQGDENAGFYGQEVLRELKAYHDPRYQTFSTLMQKSFDQALDDFPPHSIDLLHIDGLHTHAAVTHDFEAWLPKMSPQGVVVLHDIRVRKNDFGVWKLWEAVQAQYPHFEFDHSHGLGILGVGPDLKAPVKDFFALSEKEARFVKRFFASLGQEVICLNHQQQLEKKLSAAQQEHHRQKAYERELTERIQRAESELERRDGYQRELEARTENLAAEIARRNDYQKDLEARAENLAAEIRRRDGYQKELEGRTREQAAEIARRGAYQKELEARVEQQAGEIDRRGEYISQLEEQMASLGEKAERFKREKEEALQALEVFERSWLCTYWVRLKAGFRQTFQSKDS